MKPFDFFDAPSEWYEFYRTIQGPICFLQYRCYDYTEIWRTEYRNGVSYSVPHK